ncbi:helix-turn-helix domain-containing protein [Nibrella viscosa]|uniref:Helix-turn-helix domain-containing protein n=1 Tax=Nibrella viscosa TaxID=1084524 RepID=A0ABP8JQT6_9BACT
MILRDVLPSPALREFVRCYRIVHLEFTKADTIPIKAYPPKPEQCLHFFLRDFYATQGAGEAIKQQPDILLAGQRTALVSQLTGPDFIDVQIVFQPTAVYRLTGIPAYELTDQHLDATFLFPKRIQQTLAQLQAAGTYTEALTIVENFALELARQVRKDKQRLDAVCRHMIQEGGRRSMDEYADEACFSPKQFTRKFFERTGVNPKTYARIIRFNRAFNLKNQYPQTDWLSIAIDCGYCDYQHLVKDYKEFTGLVPNELHRLESQSPERILGLTDTLYRERVEGIV